MTTTDHAPAAGQPVQQLAASRALAALVASDPLYGHTDVDRIAPADVREPVIELLAALMHLTARSGADVIPLVSEALRRYHRDAPPCTWIGHVAVADAALGNPCRDCARPLTFDGTAWQPAT